MSDVEVAQTGAIAAPVETPAIPQDVAQATPQESAPAETDELQDGQPRDKDGKFAPVQKRINELTRQRYEAERRAQDLERRLQELERQPSRAPDPEQDPNAYIEHVINERAAALAEERAQQSHQQQERQRIESLLQQSAAREVEYAKAHPDYHEAADTLRSILGVNPAVAEVMLASDHGPAVAHYLGTHIDEAVALSQLPPHLAVAAVVRLEAKVSAPKPKPVSSAPTPVPSVGGASVAPRGLHDELSIDDWMRERSTS